MLIHVKHCLHKMNDGKSCKNCYKVLDYKSKWYPSWFVGRFAWCTWESTQMEPLLMKQIVNMMNYLLMHHKRWHIHEKTVSSYVSRDGSLRIFYVKWISLDKSTIIFHYIFSHRVLNILVLSFILDEKVEIDRQVLCL